MQGEYVGGPWAGWDPYAYRCAQCCAQCYLMLSYITSCVTIMVYCKIQTVLQYTIILTHDKKNYEIKSSCTLILYYLSCIIFLLLYYFAMLLYKKHFFSPVLNEGLSTVIGRGHSLHSVLLWQQNTGIIFKA